MQAHQSSVDYYAVLGVARDASTKEINIAFKKLALKLHPDKCGGDERSIEYFRKTQEAVETLRDPELRRKHDASLGYHSNRELSQPFEVRASRYEKQRYAEELWQNRLWQFRQGKYMRPWETQVPDEPEHKPEHKPENTFSPFWTNYEIYGMGERPRQAVEKEIWQKIYRRYDREGSNARAERQDEEIQAGMMPDKEKKMKKEGPEEESDAKFDLLVDSDEGSDPGEPSEYASAATSFNGSNSSNGSSNFRSSSTSGHDNDRSGAEGVRLPDSDIYPDGDDTVYFDCTELPTPGTSNDQVGEEHEKHTHGEDEVTEDNSEAGGPLWPFIPHFGAKLNDPSGRYTLDDMYTEIKGLVMETYCGWLESKHILPSFAEAQSSTAVRDTGNCSHIGFWKKDFGCPECEFCHLWKPIFVLTCPRCGAKACVGCKFSDGG